MKIEFISRQSFPKVTTRKKRVDIVNDNHYYMVTLTNTY